MSGKMKSTVVALFMLAMAQVAVCQNNTISPYSKYGIGLYEQMGHGRNTSMGGVGIALRSERYVNTINPASYASLDSTMVLFDIGVHMDYEHIETHLDSGDKMNGNVSYFSLTMAPSDRLGISFGLAPYTSVGYTLQSKEYVSGGGEDRYMSYVEGLGGLTWAYVGLGVDLFKHTSLGMNASILFGPKTERQSMAMTSADEFSIYIEKTDYYTGGKLDFGLQQDIPLSKNKTLTIGAIASTPGILRCSRKEIATNTFYRIGLIDTVYFDDDDYDRYTKLPPTFGFGVSYSKAGRFTMSGDFNYNPLSKLDVEDLRSKLIDNKSINIGCEFIPKKLGHSNDLVNDIVFRAGGGFESGICRVDHYTLKSFKLSAGVGFRIRSIRFNTYCMYKQQGTLDNLLVLHQSLQFGLNLTYIDYWFQKRRFY